MTLRDAVLSLDPYQVAQIESISLRTANHGYQATMEQWGMVLNIAEQALPDVAYTSTSKRDPFIFRLDWSVPAWDQVLALVQDTSLTQPDCLGTMTASEGTYTSDTLNLAERDCHWHIVTHGKPRSSERRQWIKSREVAVTY